MSSILDDLRIPFSWQRHSFGRLVARSKESGRPDLQPLSVFLDAGVVPRASREDNFNRLGEDLSKYLVVKPGDVVFNKLRTWQGGLGVSRYEGIVSPAYFVCRPLQAAEPRFIHYLLRSVPYLAELTRVSKFMPPSQFDILWDDLRLLPTILPPLATQQAISDFLDAETARIDALVTKKRRLVNLLEERRSSLLENVLLKRGVDLYEVMSRPSSRGSLPDAWTLSTLGRALRQLTNGYVGPTRDILADEGIRYIQGMHIKKGRIDFDRRPFYVHQEWYASRPRISLQPGDVLIVQTGDIGQAAVVPPNFGPASCHALLIARPNHALVSSDFLGLHLQSAVGHNELLRLATGALHPHLEFGVRVAPILVPPAEEQKAIVDEVQEKRRLIDETVTRLNRQVALLQEHRQALITAAVTGELNIPGVVA